MIILGRRKAFRDSNPWPTTDLLAVYELKGNVNDTLGNYDGSAGGSLTYTTDRYGKANSAADLDGSTYCNVNALTTPLASLTQGDVCAWFRPVNENLQNALWSTTNNSSSVLSELSVLVDSRVGALRYFVLLQTGTLQYLYGTAVGSISADFGNDTLIQVGHDGVAPYLYRNGSSLALSRVSGGGSATKWFKDCFDYTTPPDTVSFGVLRRNGGLVASLAAPIDDIAFYSTSQAANASTIYNATKA